MRRTQMPVILGIVVVLLLPAGGVWGQFQQRDIDDYMDEALGAGTTSDARPYFADSKEQLRQIDLGPLIPTDDQGRPQEVLILVLEGERIFCAHCNDLLRDTVQFRRVTMEQSVNYFDDGTHGDMIPNDGLPSRVNEIRNDFIGPRCYQHMIFLESLRDRARFRDAHTATFLGTEPMVPEEPQSFFSQVEVAPLDSESRLAVDPMARIMPGTPGVERRYSFVALDRLREEKVREFEETVIYEFKRKPLPINYYLHRNEINPYAPRVSVRGIPGGSGRPVPTPPTRTGRLRDDATSLAGRPVPY